MTVTIRTAALRDADAICTVYNQGIVDRVATLESALRTPEERRQWLAGRDGRHPVIVADVNGVVVGWASLNQFNPREAYDHVADFSVYVERSWRLMGGNPEEVRGAPCVAREHDEQFVAPCGHPDPIAGEQREVRQIIRRVIVARREPVSPRGGDRGRHVGRLHEAVPCCYSIQAVA